MSSTDLKTNNSTSKKATLMELNESHLPYLSSILSKLNYEEFRVCELVAMYLLTNRKADDFNDMFYQVLNSDFGILGRMPSNSIHHKILCVKIRSFDASEKELLASACHQYITGRKHIAFGIAKLALVDIPLKNISLKESISNEFSTVNYQEATSKFTYLLSSVCCDIDVMDDVTIFSIPASIPNADLYLDIFNRLIEELGYKVNWKGFDEKLSEDYQDTVQVNYVIETNFPGEKYFELITAIAA
jgi:hypothetical protein